VKVAAIAGALGPVLLSAWLGGAILVAAVVAPAAFAVLPSRALAGALVGRILPALFISGIVVALVVMAFESAAGRHLVSIGNLGPLGLLIIGCAIAQFAISPRIERIRIAVGAPIESLDAGDARRQAFGTLHAFSVMWLGIAMLGAAVAIGSRILSTRSIPK
jgi:hypothetical protein